MPNLLDELASADGPIERVQRGMRRALPKRFYKEANVAEGGGGFEVRLDGKPAQTPAKRALVLPSRALAEAVAAEWAAQGETINPGAMPLTRLANVALDRVTEEREAVVSEIAKYAGTDLVCYRASEPEGLVAAQKSAWDPVLEWARDALGARFLCAEGVQHTAQPPDAISAVRAEVAKASSPLALAALASATALSGSALIALALARESALGGCSLDSGACGRGLERRPLGRGRRGRWSAVRPRRAEFDAAAKVLALT